MTEREKRLQSEADRRWREKQAAIREWVRGVALAAGVEPVRLAKTDPEAIGDTIRDIARAVPRG